jgi:hypothetical protein
MGMLTPGLFKRQWLAHAAKSFDRGVCGPVRREIDRVEAAGSTDRAREAKVAMSAAYDWADRGDLPRAHCFVCLARESLGLLPSGTAAAMGIRLDEVLGEPCTGNEPDATAAPPSSPPSKPAMIAPGVGPDDLWEVCRHEAAHASLICFLGCKLDSAVARRDGSGETAWRNDPAKSTSGRAHNLLCIAFSAYRLNQLCGRQPEGCGSDLERMAEAVSMRTGKVVSAQDVLRTEEVAATERFLDELLNRLAPVIGTFARALYEASPNAVGGQQLQMLWNDFMETDPLRPSYKW